MSPDEPKPVTRAAKVLSGIEGKAWVEKDGLHPMRVECMVVTAVPVFGDVEGPGVGGRGAGRAVPARAAALAALPTQRSRPVQG